MSDGHCTPSTTILKLYCNKQASLIGLVGNSSETSQRYILLKVYMIFFSFSTFLNWPINWPLQREETVLIPCMLLKQGTWDWVVYIRPKFITSSLGDLAGQDQGPPLVRPSCCFLTWQKTSHGWENTEWGQRSKLPYLSGVYICVSCLMKSVPPQSLTLPTSQHCCPENPIPDTWTLCGEGGAHSNHSTNFWCLCHKRTLSLAKGFAIKKTHTAFFLQ